MTNPNDYAERDAAAIADLEASIAQTQAHLDAERAIVAGSWPHVCARCEEPFHAGRHFPYCSAECAAPLKTCVWCGGENTADDDFYCSKVCAINAMGDVE